MRADKAGANREGKKAALSDKWKGRKIWSFIYLFFNRRGHLFCNPTYLRRRKFFTYFSILNVVNLEVQN